MWKITTFKNLYDKDTTKVTEFTTWEDFAIFLGKLSSVRHESKKSAPLISQAVFKEPVGDPEKDGRKNINVVEWSRWAVFDIDTEGYTSNVISEVREALGEYSYVLSSTASSRKDHPKFRIYFELESTVPHDKIKHFWHALVTETNLGVDKSCKDLSRCYYIPGKYPNAFHFFDINEGKAISPDDLMERHKYVELSPKNSLDGLPDTIKNAMMNHRRKMLTNFDVNWTNYRDCPFMPKQAVEEYKQIAHIDNSGRYYAIYQIMVKIAVRALKERYPITPDDIVKLIRELDMDTANRYQKRPLKLEARRAIDFAFSTAI